MSESHCYDGDREAMMREYAERYKIETGYRVTFEPIIAVRDSRGFVVGHFKEAELFREMTTLRKLQKGHK